MRPEKHFARVVSAADPEKQGRARVEAGTIVEGVPLEGDDAWFPVDYPFAGGGEGWYYPPNEDALAVLEVEADPERGTEEIDARVTGFRYTDRDPIPEEFRSDPTNRGGVKFGAEVLLQDRAKALTALISAALRLGLEDATHPVVRGDTLNDALTQYLTAEEALAEENVTQFAALAAAAAGLLAPLKQPFEDLATAWGVYKGEVTTFKNAAPGWLSTRVKTE